MAEDTPAVRYDTYAREAGRFRHWPAGPFADGVVDSLADLAPIGGNGDPVKNGLRFCLEDPPGDNVTLATESPVTHAMLHELASRLAHRLGCRIVPMEVTQGEGING